MNVGAQRGVGVSAGETQLIGQPGLLALGVIGALDTEPEQASDLGRSEVEPEQHDVVPGGSPHGQPTRALLCTH